MLQIIRPSVPYVPSFDPVPKAELEKMNCMLYVNLGVSDSDLEQFDLYFLESGAIPVVWSSFQRNCSRSFYIEEQGKQVPVDWRVACTWLVSFRFRYEEALRAFELADTYPKISESDESRLSRWMNEHGKKPKLLSQCENAMVASTSFPGIH